MYRHHPQTARLEQLVAEGAIGELRLVRTSFSDGLDDEGDIRLRPELDGGALMDVGCYCVSGMRLLAGEPQTAYGQAWFGPSGTDWVFAATLRFAGDVIGSLDCGTALTPRAALEAGGSEGSLFLADPWRCALPVIELRRGGEVERIEVERADPYRLELENLSDAIRGAAEPLLGRADAIGQARALLALERSARSGAAVPSERRAARAGPRRTVPVAVVRRRSGEAFGGQPPERPEGRREEEQAAAPHAQVGEVEVKDSSRDVNPERIRHRPPEGERENVRCDAAENQKDTREAERRKQQRSRECDDADQKRREGPQQGRGRVQPQAAVPGRDRGGLPADVARAHDRGDGGNQRKPPPVHAARAGVTTRLGVGDHCTTIGRTHLAHERCVCGPRGARRCASRRAAARRWLTQMRWRPRRSGRGGERGHPGLAASAARISSEPETTEPAPMLDQLSPTCRSTGSPRSRVAARRASRRSAMLGAGRASDRPSRVG